MRLTVIIVLVSYANEGICFNYGIPENWKDYITKDILRQYSSKALPIEQYQSFQGDISGIDPELPASEIEKSLNNFVTDRQRKWTNGIVPYNLSSKFTEEDRKQEGKTIRLAMDMVESATGDCIKFVPRKNEADYISIVRGFGCSSAVGRQGGMQVLSLAVGCLEAIGSIQHELMHALGFQHEMSRADRDDYIWINWDNVDDKFKKDFKIPTGVTTFGLPYDYSSVLHYPYNAFAIDPSAPTIIPKRTNQRIGQTLGLSFYDSIRLNKAYQCDAPDEPVAIPERDKGSPRTPLAKAASAQLGTDQPKSSFSHADCKELNVKVNECFIDDCSNPDQSILRFFCTQKATSSDVSSYLSSLPGKVPSSARLKLNLYGDKSMTAAMMAPVASQIVFLDLRDHTDFSTDVLSPIPLTNLIELRFYDCKNVRMTRNGVRNLHKLTALSFLITTIASIEVGTLESLPSLKRIVWDFGMNVELKAHREHLQRFHCSPDYAWLREYFDENPTLLEPRRDNAGEGWPLPKDVKTTYYPVDCHDETLTQSEEPFKFSVNVHKKIANGWYVVQCFTNYAGTGQLCGSVETSRDIKYWNAACGVQFGDCCVDGAEGECHWQE